MISHSFPTRRSSDLVPTRRVVPEAVDPVRIERKRGVGGVDQIDGTRAPLQRVPKRRELPEAVDKYTPQGRLPSSA